jgi:hypothetical protein
MSKITDKDRIKALFNHGYLPRFISAIDLVYATEALEWALRSGHCPAERPDFPYCSFDARDWASEFCRLFPGHDEGLMIGWFANALMRGFDQGKIGTSFAIQPEQRPQFLPSGKAPSAQDGKTLEEQIDASMERCGTYNCAYHRHIASLKLEWEPETMDKSHAHEIGLEAVSQAATAPLLAENEALKARVAELVFDAGPAAFNALGKGKE